MFQDCAIRPHHDFQWRTSNFAGGQPGEIGGILWRIESIHPERASFYGVPIGTLSLDEELRASGKLCLRGAAADSAILVGWFNSLTAIGAPPANFLGILIEGPSRVGHYVRPLCRNSEEVLARLDKGPILRPDRRTHEWVIRYLPHADNERGRMTVSLDGSSVSLPLPEGMRNGNATFDRFGFLSYQRGGHFVNIRFDDVSYTANAAAADRCE